MRKVFYLFIGFILSTCLINAQEFESTSKNLILKAKGVRSLWVADDTGSVGVHLHDVHPNYSWGSLADFVVAGGSIHAERVGWAPSDNFAFGTESNKNIIHYGMSRFAEKVGSLEQAPKIALSGYYGLKFFTRGKERINITDAGNVGIGVIDPQETLHVNGAIRGNIANGALRVKSADGYLDLGAQNANWAHIYTDRPKVIFNKDVYTISNGFSSYNNDLILKTKGSERLRINDETGNVGIGTINPSTKLEVNGDISLARTRKIRFLETVGGDNRAYIGSTNGENGDYNSLVFATNAEKEAMRIKGENLGIGTTDPKSKLHIKNNNEGNSNIFLEDNTGNKMIMETSSGYEGDILEQYGKLALNNSSVNVAGFEFYSNSHGDYNTILRLGGKNIVTFYDSGAAGIAIGNSRDQVDMNINGNINIKQQVNVDQKLHIGNTRNAINASSAYSLSVEGKAIAEEVKVQKKENWSDFVFYDDYKLPTLKEVESYIEEKGHLKDIPSAQEVAKEGFFLGEMDAKLLQKIEELTLYTIAQEKKITALERENKINEKVITQLNDLLKRVKQLEEN